jgi:hypothetical protein
MGYSGDLRACTYCCHIVLSCLKSIDPSTDGSTDLSKIQEDLQKKLALLQPNNAARNCERVDNSGGEQKNRKMVLKRKISLSFQEERFTSGSSTNQPLLSSAERKVLLHDSSQLKVSRF